MHYRAYDPQKDKENARRIWRETGWLDKDKEDIMDTDLACGRPIVADINGEPECLVITVPGDMRYLNEKLSLSAVTAVTTSRIARKQGLAKRLAAQAVANDASDGALVAGLGMFEQGYYNQIGFATGGYELLVHFDPSLLNVRRKARVPRRLKLEDYEIVHAARLARKQGHGACNLGPLYTKAQMMWGDHPFGLGYCDGPDGKLTHFLWARAKEDDVVSGPYRVEFMAYQTGEQFLELMALLRSLGDQVRLIKMLEPPDIQLQDLMIQPFKQQDMTRNSNFATGIHADAWWQRRICNLEGCLERTHLRDSARFNLKLSDPIAACLDEKSPWRGVGGDYVVTLGPSSGAEKGTDGTLPTLTASVGAFTRMWLGVRPASGLAVTDELSGPPALIEQLDHVLLLPIPRPDWEF
jgi:hypothetical protein